MSIVNFGSEVRTMTSREIAEITGKQHKHVLEDVRKMLEELGITAADFATQYKDSYGRMQPCFNLPKRETLCLVLGYSFPMYERIVDRWDALESGEAVPAMVARIVDRWEALETGKAVPSMVAQPYSAAVEAIQVADALANMLRLEGSARLDMAQKAVKVVRADLLPMVPVYATNAK